MARREAEDDEADDDEERRHHGASRDYASCEECGAPLDEKQRYCVSCGARRRDRGRPAVQYFASAGDGAAAAAGRAPAGFGRQGGGRALLRRPADRGRDRRPGRQGQCGNNNDQGIADAIKSLQATRRRAEAELASTAATTPITSDFTLDKGYTVELKTLPVDGTDQAAVDAAKQGATSQGAADVGIINTSEFAVTPAPPANTYVLYSGQFKSKAEATKALGKLKGKFKDAQVVSVKKSAGDEGQLVNKTHTETSTRSRASRPTPRRSPRTPRSSSRRRRRRARTTSTPRRTCPT